MVRILRFRNGLDSSEDAEEKEDGKDVFEGKEEKKQVERGKTITEEVDSSHSESNK